MPKFTKDDEQAIMAGIWAETPVEPERTFADVIEAEIDRITRDLDTREYTGYSILRNTTTGDRLIIRREAAMRSGEAGWTGLSDAFKAFLLLCVANRDERAVA